eukprot:6524891-Alexandrium_andersonii.AAC.1
MHLVRRPLGKSTQHPPMFTWPACWHLARAWLSVVAALLSPQATRVDAGLAPVGRTLEPEHGTTAGARAGKKG